jgi:hypothetical protein
LGIILQPAATGCFQLGSSSATAAEQGRVLGFACYFFKAVPGITVTDHDVIMPFRTDEIDA